MTRFLTRIETIRILSLHYIFFILSFFLPKKDCCTASKPYELFLSLLLHEKCTYHSKFWLHKVYCFPMSYPLSPIPYPFLARSLSRSLSCSLSLSLSLALSLSPDANSKLTENSQKTHRKLTENSQKLTENSQKLTENSQKLADLQNACAARLRICLPSHHAMTCGHLAKHCDGGSPHHAPT
jgi:hypothetical protein